MTDPCTDRECQLIKPLLLSGPGVANKKLRQQTSRNLGAR